MSATKAKMMEKIITRTMTGFCLGLLVFYAYAFVTIQPASIWAPPVVVNYGCCYWIGGTLVCIPCHAEETK